MSFRNIIILLLTFLALHQKGFSQGDLHQLCGIVNEKNSGIPVSHLPVTLEPGNKTILTDISGKFCFDDVPSGTYRINAPKLLFSGISDTVNLASDTLIRLVAVAENSILRTVDVITDRKITRAPNIAAEITPAELSRNNGKLLGEILKNLPGMQAVSTGTNVSKPMIHGLHSNRVMILNNGVKIESQQWGSDHGPEIDPFITKKIIVIKGAGTLKYGPEAIGGVILTESEQALRQAGIAGSINTTASDNGQMGAVSGRLEWMPAKLKGLHIMVQGTLKKGGNVRTPHYYLTNTGVRENNFTAGLTYDIKKWKFSFFQSRLISTPGIFSGSHTGNITDLINAIERRQPQDKSSFTYDIERPYQHIDHELSKGEILYSPNDKNKIQFLYARQFNERSEYDKHRPLNDSLAALNLPELLMKLTTHSGWVNWNFQPIKNYNSEIQLSGIDQANTYSGRYFIPNYKLSGYGFYTSQKLQSGNNSIELSVRYDSRQLQIFRYKNGEPDKPLHRYSGFSSSFNFQTDLSKRINLIVNAATAFRPPAPNELYSDGLHHGAASVEKGRSDLVPERLWSMQTTANIKLEKLRFEVTPYINYIKNFIYTEPQANPVLTIRGAFPLFIYNQSDVIMRGIDQTINYTINEKWTTTGTISLLRANHIKTGEYLIMMPSDSYRAQIDFFPGDFNKFSNNNFRLSYYFSNKQWRVPAESDLLGPPPAYHLLDVSYSSDFIIGKQALTFSVTVSNLLNTEYRNYLNRFRYFADEQGRNITLRISIPFHYYQSK